MNALPSFFEVPAAPDWAAVDFISDLHLWTRSPQTVAAWTRYMQRTPADAVFILGDLFEVWVGDDAQSEPFEASCLEVLSSTASRRWVGIMHGNRDFLLGADALTPRGVHLLPDPSVLSAFGRRVLLTHGDELCLADVDYQRYRATVRSPAVQAQFLSQPLAARQAFVRQLRDQSEDRKAANPDFNDWADVDAPALSAWMDAAGAADTVHGHTHRPGDELIAPGKTRRVLTDWVLGDAGPGPERAEVLRLTAGGFARLGLSEAIGAEGR